ncbi:hypothetical protein B0A48_05748 [Cryoendolithus antarcticus]|uniref:Uncharacterized protein n=1 Tax=Cryoendolithus antarcticus TaxID=1507870 RepID=A0A1V8TC78_9PEZI|nr:hypothetical protein B0A48_05748 [Cryoendolithus antarcticus]
MSVTGIVASTYAAPLWSNTTVNTTTPSSYSPTSNATALNCIPCTLFQFEPGYATWSSTAPVQALATTQLIVDPNRNTTSTSITCNTAVLDSYTSDFDLAYSLNDQCELVAKYIAVFGSGGGTAGFQWATATLTEPSGVHIQIGGNVNGLGEISTTDADGRPVCTTFQTFYSTALGVYTGPLTTDVTATWTKTETYTLTDGNSSELTIQTTTETANGGGLWLMPDLSSYFPGLAAISQCGSYIIPGGVPLALQPASYVVLPASTLPRTLPGPPSTTLVSNGPTSEAARPGNSPVTALPQVTDGPQPTSPAEPVGRSSANNAASPSAGKPAPPTEAEPTTAVVVPVPHPTKPSKPSPPNAVSLLDSALAFTAPSTPRNPPIIPAIASYIASGIAPEQGGPSDAAPAAPQFSIVPGVPSGYVVGGSKTIQPGGPPATVAGTTFSALPFGQGVAVNGAGHASTVAVGDTGSASQAGGIDVAAVNGPPSYVLNGHSISAGGPAYTNAGTVYSALPSAKGVLVSVNGAQNTIPYAAIATPSPQLIALTGSGAGSAFVFGDTTFSAGGQAVRISGMVYSALPAGSGVLISAEGVQSTIPYSALATAAPVAIALAEPSLGSTYVFGGITLCAGGPALTSMGGVYSAQPNGKGILASSSGQSTTISPGASVNGVPVSLAAGASPGYVIAGTTLSAGGAAVTSNGVVYTALPSASGVLEITNGRTTTLHPPIITGAAKLPQVVASGSDYVIEGSITLTPGGPESLIFGTEYTALPSGSGVLAIANGQFTTLTAVSTAAPSRVSNGGASRTGFTSATATDGSTAATSGAGQASMSKALCVSSALLLLLLLHLGPEPGP